MQQSRQYTAIVTVDGVAEADALTGEWPRVARWLWQEWDLDKAARTNLKLGIDRVGAHEWYDQDSGLRVVAQAIVEVS